MTYTKKKYYFKTSSAVIALLILELVFWLATLSIYQYLSLNVKEFRFEYPSILWLFTVIVLLNIFWIRNKIWKRRAIFNFAEINTLSKIFNGFSNNRSTIKYFIFRISVGLLIIAAANPQYGENERTVVSKGIDIMIALDISKSMMAEDLVPDYNRLDIAKLAIGKLLTELKGDHVGVVVFAGEAYKQLPLTPDYQVAKLFLKSIGSDMISSQGTDIGKGFEKIMDAFSSWFSITKKSKLKTVYKDKSKVGGYTKGEFNQFNNQKKIDIILDKISKSGYDSLTKEEKEFLFKAGK